MKEYGDLLGTEEARRFSARVQDVHEWLATRIDDLPEGAATSSDASGPDASGSDADGPGVGSGAQRLRIAVQDPCHLRWPGRGRLAAHQDQGIGRFATVFIIGGRTAVTDTVRDAVTTTAPPTTTMRRITGSTRTHAAAETARQTLKGPSAPAAAAVFTRRRTPSTGARHVRLA